MIALYTSGFTDVLGNIIGRKVDGIMAEMFVGFLATDGEKQVATNFKAKEFKSRTCPVVFIDGELIQVLQGLRAVLRCPINVNSGYRTEAHNKAVGGSTNSAHLLGKAADISCGTLPAKTIALAAYRAYGKKIAIGLHEKENYVHIDVLYRGNFYKEKVSNKVKGF